MPEQGIRSTYSQCPFQLQMCDTEGTIGTGTGFFFELEGEWFLITNWHNVSGKHAVDNTPLSKSSGFPEHIEVKFATNIMGTGGFTTVAHRVEIYENYEPLWYEHPDMGSLCDVVALPMELPQNTPPGLHNAANLISQTRIPIEPGVTVFVIGFPRSISVGFGLPLWKAGYIASEPYYDVTIGGQISEIGGLQGGLTLPAFFIDSQTREGMSGSPVFGSYTGTWDTADPYGGLNFDDPDFWNRSDVVLGGTGREFLGCYSGRVGSNEEGAALGLCWRKDVIELICTSKRLGQHPHVTSGSHIQGM